MFFPIDLIDDTPTGLVLGGIPADARIIVAGQDLVTEGDRGQPVEADAETIKKLGEAARRSRNAIAMDIVKLAINNARLTISVLFFLLLAGALAYQSTPKEAEPDVPIPMMYVSLIYQGISPEDSERLLLRPMETKLKSLKGLKEMRSAAFQGGGYVLVEFQPSTIWRRRCRTPAARCRTARPTCRRPPRSRRSTRSTSRNSRCWW